MRTLSAILIGVVLCCLTSTAHAAWSGASVADWATGVERSWTRLTDADGRVRDVLEPAYGSFNYGTLMLAQAQLRAAARVPEPTPALEDAAIAQILGSTRRDGQNDPFHLLAGATLLRDGEAGLLPPAAWERIELPLVRWLAQLTPFLGHDFASRTAYDNWRLVNAAAGAELAGTDLAGVPGSVAEDLERLRTEVRWTVSTLMPRHAGPPIRARGAARLGGPARVLSDPPWQPHAYHLFSTLLLERVHRAWPQAFGPAALRVRADAGRYALALMAPDGQLTHIGRSAEQSWVLAAAVDLGVLRAAAGGSDATRWRAFAERAMDRLARVHGTLEDGTIPVVPGLRSAWDALIMDGYASMTQYNGLTLFLLQDAIEQWPEGVPSGSLPSDRDGALVADAVRGGSGLVWGRGRSLWWALAGRRAQHDGRYQQGIVSAKLRQPDGSWRELLATRPQRGGVSSGWLLRTPRGLARLVLDRVAGSGGHARLRGWWRLEDGTRWRRERWVVRTRDERVLVQTERLRRGESLRAALWTAPGTGVLAPGGVAGVGECLVTASGEACPRTLSFAAGALPRVAIAADPLGRAAGR